MKGFMDKGQQERNLPKLKSFKMRHLAESLTNALCICESIQNGEIERSTELEKSVQSTVEVLCTQILNAVKNITLK